MMEAMLDEAPIPILPLCWTAPSTAGAGPPAPPDLATLGETEGVGSLAARPDVAAPPPDVAAPPPDVAAPPPDVVVRTSTRRRKTATAFWDGGQIIVVVPAHVRRGEREKLTRQLVDRLLARRPHAASSDADLARRAAQLADRYVDGVRPTSIRWVTNQGKRWGSCTNQTGEIRLSHRLRPVPEWVLDATIVHELAHLLHADHSPRFHAVADRYPRQREAAIFLEGYSLGLSTPGA